ncbi:phage integrase N-terminal SAM-like domain-containing protein [Arhodomonas sp. AD133]|uniref:phage integrase N-terminal SAM-like domain-containing protein n=1 Tax=Arhodomonas sp. AD133 TaxID=3415009 RepID=UPI003EBD9D8B
MSRKSSPFLDRVRSAIQVRHYSIRTEEAYVTWIRRFILYHDKRHPQDMGTAEVAAFLTDLATTKGVAAATQNQALNALVFLYDKVLEQPLGEIGGIVRAKPSRKLPVVLTPDEIGRVLRGLSDVHWLIACLQYGSGLRLMESVSLPKRGHVDSYLYRIDTVDGLAKIRDGKFRAVRWTPSCYPHEILKKLESSLPEGAALFRICFYSSEQKARWSQQYDFAGRNTRILRCPKEAVLAAGFSESWDDGFRQGEAYLFWTQESAQGASARLSNVGIPLETFEVAEGESWLPMGSIYSPLDGLAKITEPTPKPDQAHSASEEACPARETSGGWIASLRRLTSAFGCA